MALHPVVIDDEQIQAIYAKYIGNEEAPTQGEYIPNGEAEQPFNPDAWKQESELVTMAFFGKIASNWQVPIENQEALASSLSAYLSQKWPNGFLSERVEKLSPGLRTLYEFGNCLKYAVDVETFTMKPMQPQHEEEASQQHHGAPEENQQDKKPYTTDV